MSEITVRQIWDALTPAEKDDACVAFWEGKDAFSRESQPQVLQQLAAKLAFREVAFKRLPPREKARHLRRHVDSPSLRHLSDDVLRSWMVTRKAAMLVCFVEAQGMKHQGGIIDDNAEVPTAEAVRKAVCAVRDAFPARDVALYLGFLLAAGADFWTGLDAAVAAEVPGLAATLVPPAKAGQP